MATERVRCGLCGVEQVLPGEPAPVRVGDGFECGHCHGLSVVVHAGWIGVSARCAGKEHPEVCWGGYVEAADVALRDARRAVAEAALRRAAVDLCS
jgi:hypothetical protein